MLISQTAAIIMLANLRKYRAENPTNKEFSCKTIWSTDSLAHRDYCISVLDSIANKYCEPYEEQFMEVVGAKRTNAFVNAIAAFKIGITATPLSQEHRFVWEERERWLEYLEHELIGLLVDLAAQLLLVSSKRRHTRQAFKKLIQDFAPDDVEAIYQACKQDTRFNFTSAGKNSHYVSYKVALA